MYCNITYRRNRVTTVTVEKQVALNIMCVCVCVCLYSSPSIPGCKSRLFCAILYSYMWPAWFYHIFPHYLIHGTNFGWKKKLS